MGLSTTQVGSNLSIKFRTKDILIDELKRENNSLQVSFREDQL